ncbi:DUF2264 domain-containing protein [Paenibacillus lautus]|uniref:DUF2264 domain-containing protein n=1 Tax=Paenibacillus lautus TaxID=1401 RepID=UPI001C0FBCC7|nr:DUF2264 domain-containing protein [Paenibacillus lautus]MBU5348326.1 DUF2264 domain-containing protein [Paenibacillus lautus]
MPKPNLAIANNPLKTKMDLANAVKQLCDPLVPYFSPNGALVDIGPTFSRTSQRVAQLEAFARPLWGLAPLLGGGGSWEHWDIYIRGITSGTDTGNREYWGDVGSCDQRQVELAALALTLLLATEHSWGQLDERGKAGLASWIAQTNKQDTVDTNWLFFRVLVNMALMKVGAEYDKDMMQRDLKRLDEFYLSDGWYKDGDTDQMDYYIPFAFHFYSLIYAKIMENVDPVRSATYKERAVRFAQDFIHWFGTDGEALVFGRSLTYRFAQSSFWGALAFAGVEAMPWGVIKGLLLRNLRWWFKQPIFTAEGILTIGYSYPNLIMAESYNAPGSPYWALKSFLPLALSDDHPFWQAEELPLPVLEPKSVQKEARMILCREASGKNVFAYTSGQHAGFEPAHTAAKYAKFAYSNLFGFSVPKGNFGLEQGAYDNNLALAEKDNLYRTRRKCEKIQVEDTFIYSLWKPWNNVKVETWIVPGAPWHVRIHRIQTERELDLAEGGFALPKEMSIYEGYSEKDFLVNDRGVAAFLPWGGTGIKSLLGEMNGEFIHAEPNTNLVHPHTMIPTLRGVLEPGTHWIASAVFAYTQLDNAKKAYEQVPELQAAGNRISVKAGETGETLIELEMLRHVRNNMMRI